MYGYTNMTDNMMYTLSKEQAKYDTSKGININFHVFFISVTNTY